MNRLSLSSLILTKDLSVLRNVDFNSRISDLKSDSKIMIEILVPWEMTVVKFPKSNVELIKQYNRNRCHDVYAVFAVF